MNVKVDNEEKYIPATQRADGTWRKARKIKDGYVPQDEIPLYQSKGKQWAAAKSSYPVGLDPALIRKKELEEAAANEKLKKQKKRPVEATTLSASKLSPLTKENPKPASEDSSAKEVLKRPTKKEPASKTTPLPQKVAETPDHVPVDSTKKLRNLKKKLKEIDALELKIKNKELKNPDKDQLEKVGRRKLLEDEIMALELSISLNVE